MEAAHPDPLGGVVGFAPDDGLALLGCFPADLLFIPFLSLLAADFFIITSNCRCVRGRGYFTAVLWIVPVWLSGGRHPFAADIETTSMKYKKSFCKRSRDATILHFLCISSA